MKKILSITIVFSLMCCLLIGCGKTSDNNGTMNNTNELSNTDASDSAADSVDADVSQTDEDMFTERDSKTEYDMSKAVFIELNDNKISASSNSVNISGSTVTITEEATYVISGMLTNGMIIVDANETAKLQILLNGVDITSKTSAALYILEADKVFVTLAEGTTNTLSNGGTFQAIDDNNIDAAVFSKQDLTFNGLGSLTVTSPVGHGIVCKDDLVFTGGTYRITSASHGLDANDSIRITGTTNLSMEAGKDGIHCENADDSSLGFVYISNGTINIEAEDDGIHAGDALTVVAGKIDILKSYEGLEAFHIDIRGGDINLVASDDGLNAAGGVDQSGMTDGRGDMFGRGSGGMDRGGPGNMGGGHGGMSSSSNGSIQVSGGTLYIKASGDGMDANGTLEISGGYTVVAGPTQGDTATLDYDVSGVITGGTFIGTGASGMAQTFSDSEQGVVAVRVGNQSADTKIILKDKSGNTIMEHTPELSFSVVILSSLDIVSGETYTITVGAETGEVVAS